jgi:hypothetical protein
MLIAVWVIRGGIVPMRLTLHVVRVGNAMLYHGIGPYVESEVRSTSKIGRALGVGFD